MSPSEDPPAELDPQPGVHLQANASGSSSTFQAGRNQLFVHRDGVHERRRPIRETLVRECPYPGLSAFGPEQARWFFGRDRLIAELLARLDQRLRTGGLQMVVAPSGAGETSPLRAGLLPQLY